ncbi:MAG: hypothetical protein Q8N03_12655 [Ignavibacteria bacterium]|jgi:hypothetical protein|nr:hypothetical protein [Ignavibacteria bacterium]MDP3831200.1 hypothetical protein [Ignavibacteriaceae bacterium]
MNTLLDILGATLIGGIIMFMMLNLNLASSEKRLSSDTEMQLVQNAKTFADVLSSDLRKLGYRYTGTALLEAGRNRLTFLGDIDSNGVMDRVTYSLGDSLQVLSTPNPRDKILSRIVNGDSLPNPSLGLVDIVFKYKNINGIETGTLSEIRFIEVEIWVEAPYLIDGRYPFTYWQMKIYPRNI